MDIHKLNNLEVIVSFCLKVRYKKTNALNTMKALQSLSGLNEPYPSKIEELIKYHECKIYKSGNRNGNNGSNVNKTDNGNAVLPSSDFNVLLSIFFPLHVRIFVLKRIYQNL